MFQIYLLVNLINGMVYVGQSIYGREYRWKKHLESAKFGSKYYIHRAIRKYGEEAFSVFLLEEVCSAEEADEAEIRWIAHHKANDSKFGYNMTVGGEGNCQLVLPVADLREMYENQELSAAQIGKRYGIGEGAILERLDAAGIAVRLSTFGRRKQRLKAIGKEHLLYISAKEVARLYIEEEKNSKEIAEMYETSSACISGKLTQMGVQTRGNKKRLGSKQKCCGCGIVKFLDEFHVNNAVSNGRMSRCKICCLESIKVKYAEGPAKESRARKEARKNRTEKKCNVCGVVKSLDAYRNSSSSPDGKVYTCKECWPNRKGVIVSAAADSPLEAKVS